MAGLIKAFIASVFAIIYLIKAAVRSCTQTGYRKLSKQLLNEYTNAHCAIASQITQNYPFPSNSELLHSPAFIHGGISKHLLKHFAATLGSPRS